jgi:hypothetical protein
VLCACRSLDTRSTLAWLQEEADCPRTAGSTLSHTKGMLQGSGCVFQLTSAPPAQTHWDVWVPWGWPGPSLVSCSGWDTGASYCAQLTPRDVPFSQHKAGMPDVCPMPTDSIPSERDV